MTLFDPATIGRERGDAAVLAACEEVAVAFCELLDLGDAAATFALHADDLAFYPPGADEPLPRAAAEAAARRMLGSYAGRRTAHVLGNFIGRQVAEDRVEAQYVVTVYELTRNVGGVAEERETPLLFGLAHERVVFRREPDGAWRYIEQRMVPIAPLDPFAGERR